MQAERTFALLEQAARVKDRALRFFRTTIRRNDFNVTVEIEIKKNDSHETLRNFRSWLTEIDPSALKVSEILISDVLYDLIAVQYPDRAARIEVITPDESGYFSEYATSRPLHTIKI